uniref:Uncharacterized protein n=1 Tax=Cannabis sativa TaxID=3483 RepID=A0A803QMP1_CANSA
MVSEELRPSASMARPTTRSQDGSAPSTINNNTTEVNSDSIPAPLPQSLVNPSPFEFNLGIWIKVFTTIPPFLKTTQLGPPIALIVDDHSSSFFLGQSDHPVTVLVTNCPQWNQLSVVEARYHNGIGGQEQDRVHQRISSSSELGWMGPLEKQVVDAWRMAMQNNSSVGFVNEVHKKILWLDLLRVIAPPPQTSTMTFKLTTPDREILSEPLQTTPV